MSEPKALLILDDPLFAPSLVGQLQHEGFHVDVVDSGLAAIRRVWEERYERVLIDRRLRGMSARELVFHVGNLAPDAEVTLLGARPAAA